MMMICNNIETFHVGGRRVIVVSDRELFEFEAKDGS